MNKYVPSVEEPLLSIHLNAQCLVEKYMQYVSVRYGDRDSYIYWFLPLQAFLSDYKSFKDKIADMELRLGFIVCQAFDDCHGCESAFKVAT